MTLGSEKLFQPVLAGESSGAGVSVYLNDGNISPSVAKSRAVPEAA
jgi:hypothetical protein